ncbi:MAG: hypothetical protein IRY94_01810 [Rhodospirillaceae bacterium]|nr:hypothetical protein [Rhodospirillaceae bacterium]
MFVELVGPPGCGKTTTARLLDGLMERQGLRYVPFDELDRLDIAIGERHIKRSKFLRRMMSLAPLLWRHPSIMLGVLVIAAVHGPPYGTRFRYARRLLAHFLFLLRIRDLGRDRIVVVHGGFVQMMWSMVIESPRLRALPLIRMVFRRYHDAIRPVGIELKIDHATAAERAFSRTTRGRFNKQSHPERRAQFGKWLAYHETLRSLLPPAAIVTAIDAGSGSEAVASRVTTVLAAIAGRRATV